MINQKIKKKVLNYVKNTQIDIILQKIKAIQREINCKYTNQIRVFKQKQKQLKFIIHSLEIYINKIKLKNVYNIQKK